jgi:D-inositol-3-phosphate glycosyltransferase
MKNRVVAVAPDSAPNQRIRAETEIAESADRIIAATPAEYTQLRWLYRANRRKVGVISPGVDLQYFQEMPMVEARQRLGLAEDSHIVLFVGRIDSIKAIDTLIQALPVVRSRAQDIFEKLLVIVVGGDPDDSLDADLAQLTALAQELDLAQHVRFVAAQDHNALLPYYASASMLVLPSIYESFGMVALEAMATGTPVVASAVGGLAYLVQDGETGYLIPSRDVGALADRIIRLLSLSSVRYAEMRTAAVNRAQQYAWSRIVDELLLAFEEVLVGGAASHHRN